MKSLGICVPVLYGDMNDKDADLFAEWVELNEMFGVSEINLYNVSVRSVSSKFRDVVTYYVNRKLVRWFNVTLPVRRRDVTDKKWYDVSKSLDGAVLNECFLENMYRFEYIMAVDLDEVVVPRTVRSHHHWLHTILQPDQQPKDIVSFVIPFAYFYLDLPANESASFDHMATMSHTKRTEIMSEFRVKSITNPRKCLYTYLHYCDVQFTYHPYESKARALQYVKSSTALVHHYRRQCAAVRRETDQREVREKRAQCARQQRDMREDGFLLQYRAQLFARLARVRASLPASGDTLHMT